jgi:hypothetical protein
MNEAGQIESASLEVVQAVEADGFANGQDGQIVANVNDVVGGQWKGKWFACGLCMFGSAVALVVAPPIGFAGAFGCAMLCTHTY